MLTKISLFENELANIFADSFFSVTNQCKLSELIVLFDQNN